ncbi:hypothetical protein COCNU_04G009560 [Cocos nucifera]|uniref:NAC domain-containing protein n=1 Tax=Cocos nucifera TaxID=13894 RepID=A0A8K0I629_COCNU|nr:hypothetical protein COCNU_04G009560 [Cocos nucifera]
MAKKRRLREGEEEEEAKAKRRSMYGLVDGMRFLPTDMELIRYLRKRAEGSPLPPALMHECNVYAQEPWNLPRDFMHGLGEEVYYFTPRASAKGSGCRTNRNAGQGFWHGNGRDQLIFDDKSFELIGHKNSLVFKLRDSKRKGLHPNWIMHEYLLHSPDNKFQEMAICKIHPKEENKMAENDYPTSHDCKKRRIHATRSILFDQACEIKDGSSSEDVAEVTPTWTEQEIVSQLVPPPELVDDRFIITTVSSSSDDDCFINSDILKWADSMVLTPPSSPVSVPSGIQPVQVLLPSDSGTPSEANLLEWIDSLLAAEDELVAQPYSFAPGSSLGHPTSADVSGWTAILEAGEDAFALGII